PKLAPSSRKLPPPLKGEARECVAGQCPPSDVLWTMIAPLAGGDVSMGHRRVSPLSRGRARAMRADLEPAELRPWLRLRPKPQGFRFRRQVPIGPFIVDFLVHEARLIVEVDGGHHFDDERRRADAQRTRWLESRGFEVLRVSNLDVETNLEG